MSRRKGRKKRQRRAQRAGNVFLTFDNAEGVSVRLPGVTAEDYARAQELAQAGEIHDPLIMRFIRAFAGLIDSVVGHEVDWATWTDADTIEFLRWLEFVPEDAWTGLDDLELAGLAGGAQ